MGLKFSLKLNDIHHAVHNRIPIHCLAYRVALPIPLFPLPAAGTVGTKLVQAYRGLWLYAPIVPDGVTLSSTQQWFVECISNLKAGICYHHGIL